MREHVTIFRDILATPELLRPLVVFGTLALLTLYGLSRLPGAGGVRGLFGAEPENIENPIDPP